MIEGVVFTALRGIVDDRCYPSTFPQREVNGEWTLAATLPAIRYTVISVAAVPDVCGTDDGTTDETRVQVDCVAMTHGAALSLRDSVIAAMQGLAPPATRDQGFTTFDAETRTHRATLDFLFHPSSQAGSP